MTATPTPEVVNSICSIFSVFQLRSSSPAQADLVHIRHMEPPCCRAFLIDRDRARAGSRIYPSHLQLSFSSKLLPPTEILPRRAPQMLGVECSSPEFERLSDRRCQNNRLSDESAAIPTIRFKGLSSGGFESFGPWSHKTFRGARFANIIFVHQTRRGQRRSS